MVSHVKGRTQAEGVRGCLGLGVMKQQQNGDNCIVRSFKICTSHLTELQFLGAFEKLPKRLLASSCPSVRMEHLGSQSTDLMKLDI